MERRSMRQYEMYELEWKKSEPAGSFVDIPLNAVFCWGEEEKSVKGFYAGKGVYKVRFLPEHVGKYVWKVTGVVEDAGECFCGAAYSRRVDGEDIPKKYCALEGRGHGPVRVCGMHFEYEDGARYTPVGTTIYALAHQKEPLIRQTLATLSKAPFNKVRYCIFPKNYDYNHNEPEHFAFLRKKDGTWDVDRPCMEFWEHFESVIESLERMGIQSDIILFHPYDRWGFSGLSMEENRKYLDYAMRRLSAFPSVWWSMANEYDLMTKRGMEDWHEFEAFLAKNDPYGHLLSNHQCFVPYDFSRERITHCSLQLRDVDLAKEFMETYRKPVIYDECAYEGNLVHDWGNISGFEMANRFWCLYAQGAYGTHGEVFLSEDEILWWAKGGILKGQSPARIAFLKEILQEANGELSTWNLQEYAGQKGGFWVEDMLKGVREDNPLANFYHSAEPTRKISVFRTQEYAGHYGKQFFLRYFGRTCPGLTVLYLPEDISYKIEVIDMWEMTRKQVYFGAAGKTEVHLPGKEGIAVLAAEIEE